MVPSQRPGRGQWGGVSPIVGFIASPAPNPVDKLPTLHLQLVLLTSQSQKGPVSHALPSQPPRAGPA